MLGLMALSGRITMYRAGDKFVLKYGLTAADGKLL
jgi:hypothetical protein